MRLAAVLAAILPAGAAFAEVPVVVADTPVTHSLVSQVMSGVGEPVLLIRGGTDPHHAQMRPSDARSLSKAALVVWVGPGMTPGLAGPIGSLVDPGRVLALDPAAVQHDHDHRLGEADGHDPAHADEHESGDHSEVRHAWLDPVTASVWVGEIAEHLSEKDPEHAETYAANAATAQARIAALDAELSASLAPARNLRLLVNHDAYGQLAAHFGLTIAGSIAGGDASTPGAAHISELQAMARSGGFDCAFVEPAHPARMMEVVLEGTDVPVSELDPEGLSLEPGAALYEQLMRNLSAAIVGCAG